MLNRYNELYLMTGSETAYKFMERTEISNRAFFFFLMMRSINSFDIHVTQRISNPEQGNCPLQVAELNF